ncbi:MAG: hypothetical protein QXY32_05230 [Nitrososphaerota archaeon]
MPILLHYSRMGRSEISLERKIDCPVCLGDFKNCRLEKCPYLKDVRDLLLKISKVKIIHGSSPPSTLVGSWGYPKVNLGPLLSPTLEYVGLMEKYEHWLDIPLEKILSMRLSLVYGRKTITVDDARNPGKLLETIQEIALSHEPVGVEMFLEKEPRVSLNLSVRTSPVGPTAVLDKIQLSENPSTLYIVEKIVSDTDLKAGEAIERLYLNGVPEYGITRLLSLGMIGTKDRRRIVPTEWSITAVDDVLGKKFRKHVKTYEWITDYQVYFFEAHYNKVVMLMMPGPWSFELIEIWRRLGGFKIYIDSELPGEKDRYPENVGGAYHAIRLPILEKLYRDKRQASVLVLAEIYEGWIPLGVWRFREISRRALKCHPRKFSTLREALDEVEKIILTDKRYWKRLSRILEFHEFQEDITDFL